MTSGQKENTARVTPADVQFAIAKAVIADTMVSLQSPSPNLAVTNNRQAHTRNNGSFVPALISPRLAARKVRIPIMNGSMWDNSEKLRLLQNGSPSHSSRGH